MGVVHKSWLGYKGKGGPFFLGGVREVFILEVTLWNFKEEEMFPSWMGVEGNFAPVIHSKMTSENLCNATRIFHNKQR